MSRATANKPMCVVTVGFTHLLLPAADGARLMTMLSAAVEVDHASTRYDKWEVKERAVRLQMEMVQASQLVMPEGAIPVPARRAGQKLLGQ